MLPKLAIVTTHPVQYNAPIFKLLAARGVLEPKVFYTWEQSERSFFDPEFKREIIWDIPLLEGYEYKFVENSSSNPGVQHFRGINNPSLLKEIEAFEPDAVLVFGWNYKSHFEVLRYFKGRIPVLFRGDSTLLDDVHGIRSLIRRLVLTTVYKYIDVALYVGTSNKEYFRNNGVKDRQLLFAPHAVETSRFDLSSGGLGNNEKLISRVKLGIPEDALVFLFAGKLEQKKDPSLLFEAFKALNDSGCHLVIVGSGGLEEVLKAECYNYQNIHFAGFQNQSAMPFVYALADVFVLPSAGPGETWGLAVNEAMASGKAIVVSDKCGCAVDLVENGKNGFTFRASDCNDLFSKLQLVVSMSKEAIKDMGVVSNMKIQDWSIEHVCRTIELSVKGRFKSKFITL